MHQATIGIDGSGGDYGYFVTAAAAIKAAKQNPTIRIVLYANKKHLDDIPVARDAERYLTIRQCEHRNCQLRLALQDLAEGSIQALVTATNSKDLLGAAARHLKSEVPRPGLIAPVPTRKGISHLMDVGATVHVEAPEVFLGWAKAGSRFLQLVHKIAEPRIGLLNIATERAHSDLAQVHRSLTLLPNYVGYAEPAAFFAGEIDLWLAEGFVGNTILKVMEAALPLTIGMCLKNLEDLPSAGARLKRLERELLSYDAHLISPLLGIKGWVFRVHGNSTADQIAKAIEIAASKYPIDQSI